jgi:hypothetical protein
MKNEIFLFHLPNGKVFKVLDSNGEYEIWRKQPNGEFVYAKTSSDMNCVKKFFKNSGYQGY